MYSPTQISKVTQTKWFHNFIFKQINTAISPVAANGATAEPNSARDNNGTVE